MDADVNLIALLRGLIPEAKESLEFPWSDIPEGSEIPRDLYKIARPIADALANNPAFSNPPSKFFLGRQLNFFPGQQSVNLLIRSVQYGPEEALEWYQRVLAVRRTDIRIVGLVYGIDPDVRYGLSNGFNIVDIRSLPDSPNSISAKKIEIGAIGFDIKSAITAELANVEEESHEIGHQRMLSVVSEMRRVMNAYVLADEGSPVVTETWSEFVDEELQAAEFGRSWQVNRTDGSIPGYAVNVTPEAIAWLERYIRLPENVKSACDVSLERLNLALRRKALGDKALDGCICLEALLSGKKGGELTHKLAVRSALLLGSGIEEREAIFKKVKKFYDVRSAAVHGNKKDFTSGQIEFVSEGISICRGALRAVVVNAQVPEPEKWELCGGPPWNRFVDA